MAKITDKTVQGLLVSRQLLVGHGAQLTPQSDAVSVARAVLTSHDAADVALATIAVAVGAEVRDKTFMTMYPEAVLKVRRDVNAFPGVKFLDSLNRVRNNFKHAGVLPNVQEWYRVVDNIGGWITEWCDVFLGVDFEGLDLSDLLVHDDVRALYGDAKRGHGDGDEQGALEAIGRALLIVLERVPRIVFPVVGTARTEDALLLTAFGVSASEYLTLHELLPTVHREIGGNATIKVEWNTRGHGHPANWTPTNVRFCLETFLDVAIKLQHAAPLPYAVHFKWVYDDVISPRDAAPVELWQYEWEGKTVLTATATRGRAVYVLQPGERLVCEVEPSDVEVGGGLTALKGLTLGNTPIWRVKAPNLEGGYANVEAALVNLSYQPQDDPLARHWLPNR
jgi:hypothetical protein